jgi:enoyl-CoA hydratase/carnithine racemase
LSSNSPDVGGSSSADARSADPDVGELRVDEPAPGIARVTISNPRKRGALDHAILDAFARVLPQLDARCLIITGEDRIFSAGYDIRDLDVWSAGHGPDHFADEAEKLIAHPFAAAIEAIEAYPYPTLAALNGHAIGGGLELAISCDLRIAATSAKLGITPAKLGLVYSHTGIRKFIDVVGAARTRDLFLTGRLIDADAGLIWGLVTDVCEREQLEECSLALARELAGNAPLAQIGNKRVIGAVLEARAKLDPQIEAQLIELRRACFGSDDFREGVQAFAEKRAPEWQGH